MECGRGMGHGTFRTDVVSSCGEIAAAGWRFFSARRERQIFRSVYSLDSNRTLVLCSFFVSVLWIFVSWRVSVSPVRRRRPPSAGGPSCFFASFVCVSLDGDTNGLTR